MNPEILVEAIKAHAETVAAAIIITGRVGVDGVICKRIARDIAQQNFGEAERMAVNENGG